MQIIIHDEHTGKKFMLKGNGTDWEIFKQSKGKMVDGKMKGKGGWTSTRHYCYELQYAVAKVLQWIFVDPDDTDVVTVESRNAVKELRKVINDRAKKITMEVIDD